MRFLPTLLSLCFLIGTSPAAEPPSPRFRTVVLSEHFFSEGADMADFNGDGKLDVVSGPFWYAGPEFRKRTAYTPARPFAIAGYSDHFFSFAHDIDSDGDVDILAVPIPGRPALWFANPGKGEGEWTRNVALDSVGGESPAFADLTGDGKPELIGIRDGAFGYASPGLDPTKPWPFTPVTTQGGYGVFTHGMGIGDVNGDGRPDLLERNGWWEQTNETGRLFRQHAFPFAQSGGSQMFAYDFDGDGDNDIVSVQNAHGWGLKWFEQRRSGGSIGFLPHEILPNRFDAQANEKSLNISQMHALVLADIDGDGVKDLVTGKRFYAHGGADAGAHQLPVLAWFRTVRTPGGVRFDPHVIGERIGVGTQLTVRDVDGNGRPDILVGNKLGTFLLLNEKVKTPGEADQSVTLSNLKRQIGTDAFAKVIRETEPLAPEEEQKSFSLPPGFEIKLFAAEPDIAKPMNMAFDAKGRMWVSSSQEYPLPAPADRKGRDSIRILEDTDGDGRVDKVATFADGLNIPIGLYPYRDGVICYSIPNIWFLRDMDRDGKADRRDKLYGPFDFSRDTHGLCNAFRRGFDGWLYACHGFNNRSTVAGKDGHEISMSSGNTFRFRLDGSRIEHYGHGLVNPFGSVFDPFGDLLVADCHTKPISLVLPGGYHDSFGKPHDGLGYVPNVMEHLHGSTAIGGLAQYNADVFPPEYRGSTFSGNVMTSRVNRDSLQRIGSSLRAREEPDFLISGDPWFRPVDLQLGPDGALYVADFYNRIIGHYEVGLNHPGRDRQRGRIWKIVYTGDRGTPDGSPIEDRGFVDRSEFESSNQTERRLAADQLADVVGLPGHQLARTLLKEGTTPSARVHGLWARFRLGDLHQEFLKEALADSHELVRSHAFRVIHELPQLVPDPSDSILAGFRDESPRVRRAAVLAAGKIQNRKLVRPLLSLFHETAPADVHLRHAIRMSLRDHLRNAESFAAVTREAQTRDVGVLADICLALGTSQAGEFLVKSIDSLGQVPPQKMSEYMRFAVRYVSPESVAVLAGTARKRFEKHVNFQLELLNAARVGIEQRGGEAPEAVRSWALELASGLLAPQVKDQPLPWTFSPHPSAPNRGNSFVLSKRRRSADGMTETPLISSFPLGEQQTGIYRSAPFQPGRRFSFYMAGHDGYPDKPLQKKNYVRLIEAGSREVLQTWSPPRNDTAQKFDWLANDGGNPDRRVYVEITDGDTAGAFAWLAVGRFSEPRLNPDTLAEDRRRAAKLAGDFRLSELREPIVAILKRNQSDRQTAAALAESVARMNSDSRLAALAIVPGIAGATAELRSKAIDAVIATNPDPAADLLGLAMQSASAAEQLRLADRLSSDAVGAAVLISLVESGRAAARLLTRRGIVDRLAALARDDEKLARKIVALTRDLPDANVELFRRAAARKQRYLQSPGSRVAGLAVFEKRCAACHQVAGKGKKVGPNLDGIGNRGLDRLVEDIVMPNRNVDIAFRSSTLVTKAGKVFNGFAKGTEGARLILIDSLGKEISIPTDSIDEQLKSTRSPMPENLGEMLSDEEFRNLLAWLLSLRSG